jgi:hypothetical protein
MLVACRLAGLSALEAHYDRVYGCTQFWSQAAKRAVPARTPCVVLRFGPA